MRGGVDGGGGSCGGWRRRGAVLKERLDAGCCDAPEDFLGLRCSRSGLKRLNRDTAGMDGVGFA